MKVYNIYEIYPSKSCYRGISLVAAETVEQANEFINEFIKSDPDNYEDSWGYSYVDGDDLLEHLFSDEPGIIKYGIYYYG